MIVGSSVFRRLRFSILALCMCLNSTLAWSASENLTSPKKVALHVFIYDDVAIEKSTEDLFQRIFATLRPDLTYRLLSVSGVGWGRGQREVLNEVKARIATALRPNESMAYLLIDSHGSTEQSDISGSATKVNGLGKIYESGVDSDFDKVFSPIKTNAEDNLRVILNSCASFCGGQESAAKRGQTFLNYFGATHGGIYGSDVSDVSSAFDYKDFIKWQYLLPSLKLSRIATITSMLIMTSMITYVHSLNPGSATFPQLLSQSAIEGTLAGTVIGAIGLTLKPIIQFLGTHTVWSRGYYFALENGKLSVGTRMIKYKELKNLIIQGSPSSACENFLAKQNSSLPAEQDRDF
jgi:hypothetical protein